MKTIVVNRWKCEHLEGAEVVATIQSGNFSRLALCLPTVTHIQSPMNLPNDCVKAELACIGDLCGCGKAFSEHLPWVFEYLFPGFGSEVRDVPASK